MKPTKEQERELWEWCGVWKEPLSNPKDIKTYLPIDLNNLFKYAVPKLKEDKYFSIMFYWNNDGTGTASIGYHGMWHKNYAITDKDHALALFWAIWEVIHDKL